MSIRNFLFLVACITLSSTAFGQSAMQSPSPMTPSRTAEMTLSNQDKDFFAKAASGGQFEVQAANLAMTKTDDGKIKDFAQMMVKDHTQLNDELQSLAQSKGISLPTTMNDKESDLLKSLDKAQPGKSFDKEYVKDQVKAHKATVDVFDNAARNSKDPDIRTFTAKALPILERHGTEAKQLEKSY